MNHFTTNPLRKQSVQLIFRHPEFYRVHIQGISRVGQGRIANCKISCGKT